MTLTKRVADSWSWCWEWLSNIARERSPCGSFDSSNVMRDVIQPHEQTLEAFEKLRARLQADGITDESAARD